MSSISNTMFTSTYSTMYSSNTMNSSNIGVTTIYINSNNSGVITINTNISSINRVTTNINDSNSGATIIKIIKIMKNRVLHAKILFLKITEILTFT